MQHRIIHHLNSFSHVQIYLFCFALPQAILWSLISQNKSYSSRSKQRHSCDGSPQDLSLWSGTGSICSNCGFSFQVKEVSLILKGKVPVSMSRACTADDVSEYETFGQTLLVTANELAALELAKSSSSLAAANFLLWGGHPSAWLSFCSLSDADQQD